MRKRNKGEVTMSEIYKLSVRQIRKVEELIKVDKANHLEIPNEADIQKAWAEKGKATAKVLQDDGQVIGEITLKQVYLLKFFWS
jgi:hypothetical protein